MGQLAYVMPGTVSYSIIKTELLPDWPYRQTPFKMASDMDVNVLLGYRTIFLKAST